MQDELSMQGYVPDPTEIWADDAYDMYSKPTKQESNPKRGFGVVNTQWGGNNDMSDKRQYLKLNMLPTETGGYKTIPSVESLDYNAIGKYGWKAVPIELAYNTPSNELNFTNSRISEALRKMTDGLAIERSDLIDAYHKVLKNVLDKDYTGSIDGFKPTGESYDALELLKRDSPKLAKQLTTHSDYMQRLRLDAESEYGRRSGFPRRFTNEEIAHKSQEVQYRYVNDKLAQALKPDSDGKLTIDRNKLLDLEKEVKTMMAQSNYYDRYEDLENSSGLGWLFKAPLSAMMTLFDQSRLDDIENYKQREKLKDATLSTDSWFDYIVGSGKKLNRAISKIFTSPGEWLIYDHDHPLEGVATQIENLRASVKDGEVIDLKNRENPMKTGFDNFIDTASNATSVMMISAGAQAGAAAGSIFPGVGTVVGAAVGTATGFLAAMAQIGGYDPLALQRGKTLLAELGSETAIDEAITLVRGLYPKYTEEQMVAFSGGNPDILRRLEQHNQIADIVKGDWTDWNVTAGKVGSMAGELVGTFRGAGYLTKAKALNKERMLALGLQPQLYRNIPLLKKMGDIKVANRTMDWFSQMPHERFQMTDNMHKIQKMFYRTAGVTEEGFKMWAVNEMLKANPYADMGDVVTAGVTGSIFNWWSLGVGGAIQKTFMKNSGNIANLKTLDQRLKDFVGIDTQDAALNKVVTGLKTFAKDLPEAQLDKAMLLGDLLVANVGQGLTMKLYNEGATWDAFANYFGEGEFMTDMISGMFIGAHIGLPKFKRYRDINKAFKKYEEAGYAAMDNVNYDKHTKYLDELSRIPNESKVNPDLNAIVLDSPVIEKAVKDESLGEGYRYITLENGGYKMFTPIGTIIGDADNMNVVLPDGTMLENPGEDVTMPIIQAWNEKKTVIEKPPMDGDDLLITPDPIERNDEVLPKDEELQDLVDLVSEISKEDVIEDDSKDFSDILEVEAIQPESFDDKPIKLTDDEMAMFDQIVNLDNVENENTEVRSPDETIENVETKENPVESDVEDISYLGEPPPVPKEVSYSVDERYEQNIEKQDYQPTQEEVDFLYSGVTQEEMDMHYPKSEDIFYSIVDETIKAIETLERPPDEVVEPEAKVENVEPNETKAEEATEAVKGEEEQVNPQEVLNAVKEIPNNDAKKHLLAVYWLQNLLIDDLNKKYGIPRNRVKFFLSRQAEQVKEKDADMWVETQYDNNQKAIALALNIVTDGKQGYSYLKDKLNHEAWHVFKNVVIDSDPELLKEYNSMLLNLMDREWAKALHDMQKEFYLKQGVEVGEAIRLANDEVVAEAYRFLMLKGEQAGIDMESMGGLKGLLSGTKIFLNRLTGNEDVKKASDLVALFNSYGVFKAIRKSKWGKRLGELKRVKGEAKTQYFNAYRALMDNKKLEAIVASKEAILRSNTKDNLHSGVIDKSDPIVERIVETPNLRVYDKTALINRFEHGDWKDYDVFRSDILKAGVKLDPETKIDDFINRTYAKFGPGTHESNNVVDIHIDDGASGKITKIVNRTGGTGGSVTWNTNGQNRVFGNDLSDQMYKPKNRGFTILKDTLSELFNSEDRGYKTSLLSDLNGHLQNSNLNAVSNMTIRKSVDKFFDYKGNKFYNRESLQEFGDMLNPEDIGVFDESKSSTSYVYDQEGNRIEGMRRVDEYGKSDKNGDYFFSQAFKFDQSILGKDLPDIMRNLAGKGLFFTIASDKANSVIDLTDWLLVTSNKYNMDLSKDVITDKDGRKLTQSSNGTEFYNYVKNLELELIKTVVHSEYATKFGINPDMLNIEGVDFFQLYDITTNNKNQITVKERDFSKLLNKPGYKQLQDIRNKNLEGLNNLRKPIQKMLQDIDNTSALLLTYNIQNDIGHDSPLYMKDLMNDWASTSRLTPEIVDTADKAASDLLKDKMIAIVDTLQALAIDPSGSGLFYHIMDSNGNIGLNKYLHKYATYVRYEQTPLNWSAMESIFKQKGWMNGKQLSNQVRGFELRDGELHLNTYVFDPRSWEKLASNLEQSGDLINSQAIREMLEIAGKDAIDGASITLNRSSDIKNWVNPHEVLGLIGGAKPRGSLKTRAMIKDGMNASPLKHAIHPEYLTAEDEVGDSMGAKLWDSLQRSLMMSNIGMITFTSAIKGDGLHKPLSKQQNGEEYLVSHKGERIYYVDKSGKKHKIGTRENQVLGPNGEVINQLETAATNPKLLIETPYITFLPSELGFGTPEDYMTYGEEYRRQISKTPEGIASQEVINAKPIKSLVRNEGDTFNGYIQIPVSGKLGMSWDSQKGDPHKLAAAPPFRMASFTKYSKYMKLPDEMKEILSKAGIHNGQDIISNYFREGNKDLALSYLGYSALLDGIDGMLKDNVVPEYTDETQKAIIHFLKNMRETLRSKMKEDDEAFDENNDDMDMDRTNRALLETYDLKRELDILDDILEHTSKNDYDPSNVMKKLPSLLLLSDSLINNDSKVPSDRATIGTVGWKVVKNKLYNAFMGRSSGSIAVLDSDRHAKADMVRLINQYSAKLIALNNPKSEEHASILKTIQRINEDLSNGMFINEHGIYHQESQGVSLSQDLLDMHGLKYGDKIFVVLTPSDSIQSMVPMVVTGVLATGKRNTLTFNKNLALQLLGRDHDIDTMSIMVDKKLNQNGQKVLSKQWTAPIKDERTGQYTNINTFNVLHGMLTEAGLHKGAPKNKLVNLRENINDSLVQTPVDRGDGKMVDVPMTNPMMNERASGDKDFANTYTLDSNPILSTLNSKDVHKSRLKFGEKSIGVFAKFGNDYGQAISRLVDHKQIISVLDSPSAKKIMISKLSDAGIEVDSQVLSLVKELKFNFGFNESKHDVLFPYQKEGAVDIFSKHPYKLDPYEWLVEFGITNIHVPNVTTPFESISDIAQSSEYKHLVPAIKVVLNEAMSNLLNMSRTMGDPAGATKVASSQGLSKKHIDTTAKKNESYIFEGIQLEPKAVDDSIIDTFIKPINLQRINSASQVKLSNAKNDALGLISSNVVALRNTYSDPTIISLNGQNTKLSKLGEFQSAIDLAVSHAYNIFQRISPDTYGYEGRINDFLTSMIESDLMLSSNPMDTLMDSIAPYSVMKAYIDTLLNVDYSEGGTNSEIYKVDQNGDFIYNKENPYPVSFRVIGKGRGDVANTSIRGEQGLLFDKYRMKAYMDNDGSPMLQIDTLSENRVSKNTVIPMKELFNGETGVHPKIEALLSSPIKYNLVDDAIRNFFVNYKNATITVDGIRMVSADAAKMLGYDHIKLVQQKNLIRLNVSPEVLKMRNTFEDSMRKKAIAYIVDGLINNGSPRVLDAAGSKNLSGKVKNRIGGDIPSAIGPAYYNMRGKASKEKFVAELLGSIIHEQAKLYSPDNVNETAGVLGGMVLSNMLNMDSLLGALPKNAGTGNSRENDISSMPIDRGVLSTLMDSYKTLLDMDLPTTHTQHATEILSMLKNIANGKENRVSVENVMLTAYDVLNEILRNPNFNLLAERSNSLNNNIMKGIQTAQEGALSAYEAIKTSREKGYINMNNVLAPPVVFGLTPAGRRLSAALRARGITPTVNMSRDGKHSVDVDEAMRKMTNWAVTGQRQILYPYNSLKKQYYTPESERVQMLMEMQSGKKNAVLDTMNKIYRDMISTTATQLGRVTNLDEYERAFNNFANGKTWTDGREIDFGNFFGETPYIKGENRIQDSEIANKIISDFVYNELGNAMDMPGIERSALRERLKQLDVKNPQDYVALLTSNQLIRMNSFYAELLDEAMIQSPELTKYYLNEMAIQVFNIYKTAKNLKKRQAKAMRNFDLVNADNNSMQRILKEADIFNMNTPWALAKEFSNHRINMSPSDIILSYEGVTIDENGNLISDTQNTINITASMVNNGQILPSYSSRAVKELQTAYGKESNVRVHDIMPFVEVTLPEIVMTINNNLMNIKDQHKSHSNLYIHSIMKKQEAITSLKGQDKVALAEQVIIDNLNQLFPGLTIKYNHYNNKVHPYFHYEKGGVVYKGQVAAEGNWDGLIQVMMKDMNIRSNFNNDYRNAIDKAGLKDFEQLALEKALLTKLYAAHKGVQAKEQLNMMDKLVNTIKSLQQADMGENSYSTYVDDMILGTIQDLQYIMEMGSFTTDESKKFLPYHSMSVNQEMMLLQGMYGKAQKEVSSIAKSMKGIDSLSADTRDFLGAFAHYIGKETLSDFNVFDVATRLEDYMAKLMDRSEEGYTQQQSELMTFLKGIQNNSKSIVRSQRYANELRSQDYDVNTLYISAEMINKFDETLTDGYNITMGRLLGEYYNSKSTEYDNTYGKENQLTRDEVLFSLTHLTQEAQIYNQPMNVQDGKWVDATPYQTVSLRYVQEEMTPEGAMSSDKVLKGIYLGKQKGFKNDYLIFMHSNGKLSFIKDGSIVTGDIGMNIKKGDRMIQESIAESLREGITSNLLETMVENFEGIELAKTKGKQGTELLKEGFAKRRELVGQIQSIMAQNTHTLANAVKNASTWTIGMQYLGGLKAMKAGLGLVGGIGALLLSPVVPGASSASMGLLGFGFGNAVGYGENIVKRILQNVFSNFRTLYELEGFKATKETIGNVLKDYMNESQKGIIQATQTFYKSEFDTGNLLRQMSNSKIDELVDLLSISNKNIVEIANGEGKNLDNVANMVLSGEMTRKDVIRLVESAKLSIKNRMSIDKTDGISNDILEMIETLKYNPITKQFVASNGQDIASLMELKRNFMEQVVDGMGQISSVIPLSEEMTRQIAQNAMARRLLDKQFDTRYSPEEMVTSIQNMINVSGGEYGLHTRTLLGNTELGKFLTMYGRFSKNNAVYYLNHIWDKIDEQLLLDKLTDLNDTKYGKLKGGYARINSLGVAEIDVPTTEGMEKKIYKASERIEDFDYMKSIQRKIALGSAVSLSSTLARVGASALAVMLGGSWIGNLLKEDEERTKNAPGGQSKLQEFESISGIGGVYGTGIQTMMALGSIAFLREGDILEKGYVGKYNFERYWSDMIQSPGKFLFSSGIGSGYSGFGSLLSGTSMNLALYLTRDKQGKLGESMDNAFKNSFYQLGNQTLGGMPMFAPVYNTGMSLFGTINAASTGKDESNQKLIKSFVEEK